MQGWHDPLPEGGLRDRQAGMEPELVADGDVLEAHIPICPFGTLSTLRSMRIETLADCAFQSLLNGRGDRRGGCVTDSGRKRKRK